MDNATFWDKVAIKYSKDPISDMAAYAQTRERIVKILQPDHRVLELGCGTGSTALELSGSVAQYVGSDIAPKMVEIAQAKQTGDTPAQLGFIVGEAGKIPDGPFDIILALNLFHLLPDLEIVLRDIYEALPSGGQLIAKTALLGQGLWVLPWIGPVLRLFGKAPYVRNLKEAEFIEMMKTVGFEITDTLVQDGTVPRLFSVARKP